MQLAPDFDQNTVRVFPPLTVPKTQFQDAFPLKPLLAFCVASDITGRSVLKTVQLDGEVRHRAVKVQIVFPRRILAAELEPRESPGTERLPELFLLRRLCPAKPAGVVFWIHSLPFKGESRGETISPLPVPLPA